MESAQALKKRKRGINEDTVKSVIEGYLRAHRKIKASPSKGAGPDFVFNGEIIETKGGDFNFDRAVKQMVGYAPKYRSLCFAFPAEAFTAHRVMQLNALAKIIYKQHSKSLRLICILTEQQPNTYRIAEFDASNLAYNVAETIGDLQMWSFPVTEAKPRNYEADMIREIDILVQAAMNDIIRRSTDACVLRL